MFAATQNSNPFVANPETVVNPQWYADSGASSHVTADYSNMVNPAECGGKRKVTVGNGSELQISHIGNASLATKNGVLNLKNVLCVPNIAKNLVSVSKLARDNNVFVEFYADSCLVKDISTGKVVMKGTLKDGLYELNNVDAANHPTFLCAGTKNLLQPLELKDVNSSIFVLSNVDVQMAMSKNVWHRRLGHPSIKVVEGVIKRFNLSVKANENFHFCEACQFGKSSALPFPLSNSRATSLFDLVHTDLWGPAPLASSEGYRYYIHFLDDYSRFV